MSLGEEPADGNPLATRHSRRRSGIPHRECRSFDRQGASGRRTPGADGDHAAECVGAVGQTRPGRARRRLPSKSPGPHTSRSGPGAPLGEDPLAPSISTSVRPRASPRMAGTVACPLIPGSTPGPSPAPASGSPESAARPGHSRGGSFLRPARQRWRRGAHYRDCLVREASTGIDRTPASSRGTSTGRATCRPAGRR